MNESYINSLPADVQQYIRITDILRGVGNVTIYFCLVTEILFAFFFFYRIIIQKLASFSSAYFFILLFEYMVYSIHTVIYQLANWTHFSFNFFLPIISEWYLYRFYAFCNTVLVLNRFTGIFCYKKHGQIWSDRNLKIIFGLVALYPFLLSGYTIGNVRFCLSEETRQQCETDFYSSTALPTHVIASNLINAFAALGLGISTALARHIKRNSTQMKHKYENYLLIQSIITSTILIIYEILVIIHTTDLLKGPSSDKFDFGWNVRKFLFITSISLMKQIFHVSSMILLFIISKTVRQSFLSFYQLDRCCRKQKQNNIVVAVPMPQKVT